MYLVASVDRGQLVDKEGKASTLFRSGEKVAADLRWGLMWGMSFAIFFSIIATCVWIVSQFAPGDPFAEMGSSFGVVLLYYLGAGAVAGGLMGLLRPVANHSFAGLIAVSTLIAFVVWFSGSLVIHPPGLTRAGSLWVAIILSVFSGPLAAFLVDRGYY